MVITDDRPEATLYELLRTRALGTTLRHLSVLFGVSALAIAGILYLQPLGWFALLAAVTCLVAYSAWAAAERRLAGLDGGDHGHSVMLRALQFIASGIGIAAAVSLPFILVGFQFGRSLT